MNTIIIGGLLILILGAVYVLMICFGCSDYHCHAKAQLGQKKVACVGDSITYGAMVRGWPWKNYPHVLGKLLGSEYHVENFGLSDRTLQSTGNRPYCKEKEYAVSLAYLPNIVIIKLGTNDSKTANWRGREEFKQEYQDFIKNYRNLPTNPRIYLCTPASAFAGKGTTTGSYAFDIREQQLREIREVVNQIGEEQGLEVIDIAGITANHREWFGADGIHPNALGAEKIAKHIAAYF